MTDEATEAMPAVGQAEPGGDLRRRLVEFLAEVRGEPAQELWEQAEELDCALEMDSKEAEVVIARLEYEVGRELAKPEDLEPEQLATIESIATLIERALAFVLAEQGE